MEPGTSGIPKAMLDIISKRATPRQWPN